jgi:hypothetical protein
VRVRIISRPTEESVDGIALSHFKVGSVYSVPVSLATLLIVEGWAEPVVEEAEPILPPISFHITRRVDRRRRFITDARLRKEFGIAADRRRRN